MKIFILGYPGEMGGANTECWHTVKLWRRFGADVHLIPTWGRDDKQRARLDAIGAVTHHVASDRLAEVPGLAGSITVGMCNSHYMRVAETLRAMGCPIVWVNCMTFMFDHEKHFFATHGPADAMIYQSEFQRAQLEPQLAEFGYKPETGHLIRGAFDFSEWEFAPRERTSGEPFTFGRAARPAPDKWSSNTWPIFQRVNHPRKAALLLGVDDRIKGKLGTPPKWAECLKPQAVPARDFYGRLHAMLAVNGGARENWPRAGLEAMAAGVPVVAQRAWGWPEMIEHGVTGFLGGSDEELAHWTATLAWDERLRLNMARAARERLENELAAPQAIWDGWQRVFEAVSR